MKKKFLKTFEMKSISNMNLLVGGMTGKKEDCNASSADSDDSRWKKDSSDGTDTIRVDDGCNEK